MERHDAVSQEPTSSRWNCGEALTKGLDMSALVISRRPGEEIIIDGPCRVCIEDIVGRRVKVAIEADEDVKILRGELEKRDDQ